MDIIADAAQYRYERRVYYRPRLKKLLWTLLCFLFGTASVLALYSGVAAGNTDYIYVLTGISLVFLGGGAAMLFRLRKRRPVLVMDADGLTVMASSRRKQHVEWDTIADVHLFPAPPMQVLTITHRPDSRWVDKAVFWRRGGSSAGYSRMAIPAVSVSAPLKKVEAEIRRRVPL